MDGTRLDGKYHLRNQPPGNFGNSCFCVDAWGEKLQGIAVGDSGAEVAEAYPELVPRSPLLVTPASRHSAWAIQFDWSHRPHTVAAIARIRDHQNCAAP